MSIKERRDGYLGYERRRKGLRGGRIDISLGTKKRAEGAKLARALDTLLDLEAFDVVEAVRAGTLTVRQVAEAAGDVDSLRVALNPAPVDSEAADSPAIVPLPDLSLAALAESVVAEKGATRSGGTKEVYERGTRALLRFFGPERELHTITIAECRDFLYSPKPTRHPQNPPRVWSPNSQRSAYDVATFLWRRALSVEAEASRMHGFTPRLVANPWKEVTPADRKTTRHSFLSHEEFAVLIRKHRGHPLCAALATCTLAGLRARELTHLRTDIDMVLGDSAAASVIHVQSREGEHGWDTKNPNSVRTVPVHEDLYPLLVEHRESGYAGRRYFFRTSRADKPLGYWTLRDSAQSGFEAVGLRYGREGDALTLHSLRHTFASWLAQEGVASRDIARLMGNTADEVDRTYAHLMPSDDRRILGRMGNPLSGEKSGVSPSTR